MVENQVGFSDISQSKAAKVREKAKKGRPPAPQRRDLLVHSAAPSSSWARDQR